MPKFRVKVERKTWGVAEFEVEADDSDGAYDEAYEQARDESFDFLEDELDVVEVEEIESDEDYEEDEEEEPRDDSWKDGCKYNLRSEGLDGAPDRNVG